MVKMQRYSSLYNDTMHYDKIKSLTYKNLLYIYKYFLGHTRDNVDQYSQAQKMLQFER